MLHPHPVFEKHLEEVFGENSLQQFSPQLKEHLYQMYLCGFELGAKRRCEDCGTKNGPICETHCRTMYSWDGVGENPNPNPVLCALCTEAYHSHWDDMFAEVNQY